LHKLTSLKIIIIITFYVLIIKLSHGIFKIEKGIKKSRLFVFLSPHDNVY
jgi:hypothetical protein